MSDSTPDQSNALPHSRGSLLDVPRLLVSAVLRMMARQLDARRVGDVASGRVLAGVEHRLYEERHERRDPGYLTVPAPALSVLELGAQLPEPSVAWQTLRRRRGLASRPHRGPGKARLTCTGQGCPCGDRRCAR